MVVDNATKAVKVFLVVVGISSIFVFAVFYNYNINNNNEPSQKARHLLDYAIEHDWNYFQRNILSVNADDKEKPKENNDPDPLSIEGKNQLDNEQEMKHDINDNELAAKTVQVIRDTKVQLDQRQKEFLERSAEITKLEVNRKVVADKVDELKKQHDEEEQSLQKFQESRREVGSAQEESVKGLAQMIADLTKKLGQTKEDWDKKKEELAEIDKQIKNKNDDQKTTSDQIDGLNHTYQTSKKYLETLSLITDHETTICLYDSHEITFQAVKDAEKQTKTITDKKSTSENKRRLNEESKPTAEDKKKETTEKDKESPKKHTESAAAAAEKKPETTSKTHEEHHDDKEKTSVNEKKKENEKKEIDEVESKAATVSSNLVGHGKGCELKKDVTLTPDVKKHSLVIAELNKEYTGIIFKTFSIKHSLSKEKIAKYKDKDMPDVCTVEFWIGLNNACGKQPTNNKDNQLSMPVGEKLCTYRKSDDKIPDNKDKNDPLTHDQSSCNSCVKHEINLNTLKNQHFSQDEKIDKVCVNIQISTDRALESNICSVNVDIDIELTTNSKSKSIRCPDHSNSGSNKEHHNKDHGKGKGIAGIETGKHSTKPPNNTNNSSRPTPGDSSASPSILQLSNFTYWIGLIVTIIAGVLGLYFYTSKLL